MILNRYPIDTFNVIKTYEYKGQQLCNSKDTLEKDAVGRLWAAKSCTLLPCPIWAAGALRSGLRTSVCIYGDII